MPYRWIIINILLKNIFDIKKDTLYSVSQKTPILYLIVPILNLTCAGFNEVYCF